MTNKKLTNKELSAWIATEVMGFESDVPDNQCCGIGNEIAYWYKDGEELEACVGYSPTTNHFQAMEALEEFNKKYLNLEANKRIYMKSVRNGNEYTLFHFHGYGAKTLNTVISTSALKEFPRKICEALYAQREGS